MRILIISDTHSNLLNFKRVLRLEGKFDMIIHLGDAGHDEDEIRELAGETCTVSFVKGNCDLLSREPLTRDFKLGKYKIHEEHGNRVSQLDQSVSYYAEELGADIIMLGHTHKPKIVKMGNVRIINPGSLSEPRQADGRPSYILMEMDGEGELSFDLKYLE